MSAPIVRTAPLGGGALARAAVAGSAPAAWYDPAPPGADAWRRRAEEVRASAGAWLPALAPAMAATGAAADRLARAARGVVVTTGQQPGLFGGPLYTWTKALGALALADRIERETGIPAAPVFWAATDDADFEEAAVTHLAVEGGVETLRLPTPPPEYTGRPLADVPLGDAGELLAALERASGSTVFPDVLRLARRAYAPAATIGGAYVTLLRELLAPLGIAVLDSSHPAVRAAAHPTLLAALAGARAIDEALARRDRELRDAGYEPQVERVAGLTPVFRVDGAKTRLRIDAAAEGASAPVGSLAPNVLLRPVVERAILPTVAYLAGPGELAYFAQVSAVADAIGAARPLAVPRWSALIVEPHIASLLERYGLAPEQLEDGSAPERAAARGAMPAAASRALEELRAAIDRAADALARVSQPSGVGAPPAAAVEGARRALEHRVARLERRFLAAAKRRETAAMRDLATLRAALRPLGRPQERVLNALPLLARHGPALLERMADEAGAHAARLVTGGAERAAAASAAAGPATR